MADIYFCKEDKVQFRKKIYNTGDRVAVEEGAKMNKELWRSEKEQKSINEKVAKEVKAALDDKVDVATIVSRHTTEMAGKDAEIEKLKAELAAAKGKPADDVGEMNTKGAADPVVAKTREEWDASIDAMKRPELLKAAAEAKITFTVQDSNADLVQKLKESYDGTDGTN